MVKIDEIYTPRLNLIKITPDIFNHIFETNDDEGIKAFFGVDSDKWLEREKEKYRLGMAMFGKTMVYFVMKDKSTGKAIGGCGYHTWYTEHNRAELGYGITDESYKRKGLMSEALEAVLRYGFNEINLHRVEALTATYNTASIKTLEKFGFTYEGLLREHYYTNGKHEDSPIYSLLKHEFVG